MSWLCISLGLMLMNMRHRVVCVYDGNAQISIVILRVRFVGDVMDEVLSISLQVIKVVT